MRKCLFFVVLLALSCQQRTELVVFHAASLSRLLADLVADFEREHPSIKVRLEPSGSLVAVRKLTELGLPADLVFVADDVVIDKFLLPNAASFNIKFCTNELVLTHAAHSPHTEKVTAENWPSVLLQNDVRIGRVDPSSAPIGYRMQMTWQLEERRSADDPTRSRLEQRLLQHIDKQNVVPDEGDLLALLQARSVDYAFMYRSTAEDHRLKITTLHDEVNLGRSELAPTYAQASVSFTPNNGRAGQVMRGAPVTYGVTIPTQARNRAGARLLLQNLLGNKGQTLLKRRGFRPLQPARCAPCQGIDEALLTMLQKGVS